ncbi:vWA domain-containing protein [Paenibacillus sabinae]|uniref:VWFA domain-containing protein n=1 Tax=Paenibacillus sabinae T27 TaxID=1268072 RepID=X4Z7A8_9BACL|nr:vWA domain-containing protein [Paenibacillus sabinae]AHV95631.1 hypothetical protein PSAB_03475 [Paenibacillus sabinae T27]
MVNNDNVTLFVVLDTSGSMSEMGKLATAANMLAYVRACVRMRQGLFPFDRLTLLLWNDETRVMALDPDEAPPVLTGVGSNSLTGLTEMLQRIVPDEAGKSRLLLLSDGNFSADELRGFKNWLIKRKRYDVRAVAVGMDADTAALKALTPGGRVYAAAEIGNALKRWPLQEEAAKPPRRLSDLSRIAPSERVSEWA